MRGLVVAQKSFSWINSLLAFRHFMRLVRSGVFGDYSHQLVSGACTGCFPYRLIVATNEHVHTVHMSMDEHPSIAS